MQRIKPHQLSTTTKWLNSTVNFISTIHLVYCASKILKGFNLNNSA